VLEVRSPEGATAGSQLQHLHERCAAGTTPNAEDEENTSEATVDFAVEGGATESIAVALRRLMQRD
jgi:hypothetical protein